MTEYDIRSDTKEEILEQTKPIFDKTDNILVTGFLRYFKTTSVLDWALKKDRRVAYVVRTNKATDESVSKSEQIIRDERRQLVTLRGKHKICPKIREHLKDDEQLSFELMKVKYCYHCPHRPGYGTRMTKDIQADILNNSIIDYEMLDYYYNEGICPAEVILLAAQEFDVVYMTYAWLHFIKEVANRRLSSIFEDTILIFDEARHLMDFGVEQEKIGESYPVGYDLPTIDEMEEFIKWFEPIADRFKVRERKNPNEGDLKENSQMVLKCLRHYIAMIKHKMMGWDMGVDVVSRTDLEAAIKFVEYQILKQHPTDDEREMLDKALLRLLWMKRHHGSELFIDYNAHIFRKDYYAIELTARQPKDKLADIIEESDTTIFVDSTPPLPEWSGLWLGRKMDLDVMTINPASKPDIKVWVENHMRRWTYMIKYDYFFDRQYALVNKILFNDPDEKWIVSCRSKNEKNYMSYVEQFGHKAIYQGGTESEGVQLSGNHLLTGLQYIYPKDFESQRKYILNKLGTDEDDWSTWELFLAHHTYQSVVQQLFRTFYHDGVTRVVLLSTPCIEIENMKKVFPYLDQVRWVIPPLNTPHHRKLWLVEGFLNDDEEITTRRQYLKKKIADNWEVNQVSRSEIYNFFGKPDKIYLKDILDELGWKGSGRGMRKL